MWNWALVVMDKQINSIAIIGAIALAAFLRRIFLLWPIVLWLV
jgi:hypothetical protein